MIYLAPCNHLLFYEAIYALVMSVRDLAAASAGAVILSASSCDVAHPPQSVLEHAGGNSGFWLA